ncbi:MAG: hypothetical protein IPK00_14375 [Deltaproteobacteria bacterium]|nr:hypothetical protein [Deltaproteobacteria bacterium]
MTSSPKVWGDALRLLQEEIPDFAFEAWIAPLAVKLSATRVVLGCPSSFHRERVRNHFAAAIERCWTQTWASQSVASELGEAARPAPAITISDMNEFSTAEGRRVEVRLPVRRREQTAIASGMIVDAARTEVGAFAVSSAGVAAGVATSSAAGALAGSGSSTVSHALSQSTHRVSPAVSNAHAHSSAEAGAEPEREGLAIESEMARPAGLRAVSAKVARASRVGAGARDVMQVEGRPRLDLDGEPAQGELPFSFESFVVGPCNALAREAALALARRRQASLNQLYLSGESGMGKTHLARAAAAEARRHGALATTAVGSYAGVPGNRAPGARGTSTGRGGVVYTTAEQFTSEFVSAMRNGRSEDFQKRYRAPIGLLVVEDVQFFDGRVKTQLELFHTVQHVLDAGGRVLLTGDRTPQELKGLSDRMRTQLARGFVAELERPDAIVRRHILRSKAAAGGVHLPPACLDLLVESTGGSVRDIESVLIQVVTTASLLGRTIDLALTRDAIARKAGVASPLAPRRVETSEIVRIVAAFFGKRPEALAARSRRRDVLVPRQLAMYLAHRYTEASFVEIGRSLGRDHPSVRNAIERVERLVLESAPLRYQVEALSERIDQTLAKRRAGRPAETH